MRPFGDGRIFVEVGEAMVNVDHIVSYGSTSMPGQLLVKTSAFDYYEEDCSVEVFTERLKGVVTGD